MSIILETVLALLLVATFYYCWRLSQKIRALQAGGTDFRSAINDFNMAVVRAENTLKEIKEIAGDTDKNIREAKKRASALAADLSILVDKGERIANKLDTVIRISPAQSVASHQPEIIQEISRPTPSQQSEIQSRAANLSRDLNNSSSIPPARKQALQQVLSQIADQRNDKEQFRRPGVIRVKENA